MNTIQGIKEELNKETADSQTTLPTEILPTEYMTQKRESQDRKKYLNIESDKKKQGTKHSGNQGHNEKLKPTNSWYKGRKRKPSRTPTNIF